MYIFVIVIQAMVNVQMLSELEEVMQFKLVPERQEAIKHMWWDRLQGCQRVVEDWQKIIQVRSLVVSPLEDMKTWLKYASLCRKSGRLVGESGLNLLNVCGKMWRSKIMDLQCILICKSCREVVT